MDIEEKWQANREKVSFAKTFPGMVSKWESLCGKTLERVVPIGNKKGCLFIFSGGLFTFIPLSIPEPSNLLLALEAGRPWLETFHTEAYRTLDALIARDRELQRKARLDKLLSAVKNNYPANPDNRKVIFLLLAQMYQPKGLFHTTIPNGGATNA